MLVKQRTKHKISPHTYQKEAIAAVLKNLKQHDRAHIVMACGSGKTLVSLWIAERLKSKRVVVFVPSLALVAQLMKEWLKVTSWKKISCLAVCSDESITRSLDNIVLNPEECDFPVTTDTTEVIQFLEKNEVGTVKVFFLHLPFRINFVRSYEWK